MLGGSALDILGRLRLDAGERVALRLGLDDADGLAVGVEQVVGLAGRAAGTRGRRPPAPPRCSSRPVLHQPAALGELAVDLLPGLLFGGHLRRPFLRDLRNLQGKCFPASP